MIPVGGERCNACGICTGECPKHAIPAQNSKDVDRELCFGCMRCVAVCPSQARAVPAELYEKSLPHMTAVCSGRKTNKLYMNRK